MLNRVHAALKRNAHALAALGVGRDVVAQCVRTVAHGLRLLERHLDLARLTAHLRVHHAAGDADLDIIHAVRRVAVGEPHQLRRIVGRNAERAVAMAADAGDGGAWHDQPRSGQLAGVDAVADADVGIEEVAGAADGGHARVQRRGDMTAHHGINDRPPGLRPGKGDDGLLRAAPAEHLAGLAGAEQMRVQVHQTGHQVFALQIHLAVAERDARAALEHGGDGLAVREHGNVFAQGGVLPAVPQVGMGIGVFHCVCPLSCGALT